MLIVLLLNNKLGNNYLILLINLNPSYSIIYIYALINNNGSAIAFTDKRFIALY